jgi:stress response protein YsnF
LVLPIAAEQVHLTVRQVDTGRGVRVHTTVSERIEEVEVLLRQEQVHVERRAVDRVVPLAEAPAMHYEGDTLVLPVLEEVLVLEKRIRIKEELRISRSHSERPHRESVPLKTEQAVVERFDEQGGAVDGDSA